MRFTPELRFRPHTHDQVVKLESETFGPWKNISLVNMSVNQTYRCYWVTDESVGIGAVFNTEHRSCAAKTFEKCIEEYFPVILQALSGEKNIFLVEAKLPWTDLIATLETWLFMAFNQNRGKRPVFEIPSFVNNWKIRSAREGANLKAADFVETFRHARGTNKRNSPLAVRVIRYDHYSRELMDAYTLVATIVCEKWFTMDASGKFYSIAPSFLDKVDQVLIERLRESWLTLICNKQALAVAEDSEENILDLFSWEELESGVAQVIEVYGEEEASTTSFISRFVAAKILLTFPRPFSTRDDSRVITQMIKDREGGKIHMKIPFPMVKENAPKLVENLGLNKNNTWDCVNEICRTILHLIRNWMKLIATRDHMIIPSDMLFLLDNPQDFINLDVGPTPENFDTPLSVVTLSTSDEDEIIWFILKRKDLKIVLIPKKLPIEKAVQAQQILDQMVSMAQGEEAVITLAENLREAARSGIIDAFETAWAAVRSYIEDTLDESVERVSIFTAAAKRVYHTWIVNGVIKILQKFDLKKTKESLFRFSKAFGVSRVTFFRKTECGYLKGWPFGDETPRSLLRPLLEAEGEEIFKSGKHRASQMGVRLPCVMKHCSQKREILVFCGFCLAAITDITKEGTYSTVVPQFGFQDEMTTAFECEETEVGWTKALKRDRLRLIREVALIWAVERGLDVVYKPTTPEPVVKALITAAGTGTALKWQDEEVKSSNGLLHASEYFYLRFNRLEKDKEWRTVKEQLNGSVLFVVVDNPGIARNYGEVMAMSRSNGESTIIQREDGRGPQSRQVRLLRQKQQQVEQILEEFRQQPRNEDLFPEIVELTKFQHRKKDLKIILIAKNHNIFNRWVTVIRKTAEAEDLSGLTILLQERFDEEAPPTLRWSNGTNEWFTVRPLVRWVEKRTMPPSLAEEETVWSFLFDAAIDNNKERAFSPENLIGSQCRNGFTRGTNHSNVRRQIKAVNIALAVEGWCLLGVQNKLEIQNWDFQFKDGIEQDHLELQPEDITPIFMEGVEGWQAQEAFRQRVFGRMTNTPFTQNLGPYQMRNFFQREEIFENGVPEKICEELLAAGIGPDFDGLSSDDVEAFFAARRPYNEGQLRGCLIGLGIEVFDDPERGLHFELPEAWQNDFERTALEDLSEEEQFFAFLPRRLHDQVDWETEAKRRDHNRECRLLHPEIVRAMSKFNNLESAGASIHPRFRGWISLLKNTVPNWHAITEPFGVPTFTILEEFSKRISFHATAWELAGDMRELKITTTKKKTSKKGQVRKIREWSDTRIGALLPKPPQAKWRAGNCFFLPIAEAPWPKHAKEGNPANEKVIVTRFEPQPWAEMLNNCWHQRYKAMFALGIKKESQILRDGKSSDLTVAEKKDIFEMARTITELWEDRRPEMIGRYNDATKTMAEKVLGKPAAVTQYLGEICEIRAMTQDEEGHWVRMDSGYIRRAIYLQIEETGNLGKIDRWSANFYPSPIHDY